MQPAAPPTKPRRKWCRQPLAPAAQRARDVRLRRRARLQPLVQLLRRLLQQLPLDVQVDWLEALRGSALRVRHE